MLTSRANVRQPMVYFTLAAMPLSFFLVFTLIAGRSLGQHAFLGAAVAYSVTAGIVSLPQTVVQYRIRQLHDMIVASPIRPVNYLLGLAVSRLLYIAPPLVVILTVFAWFSEVPPWRVLATLPWLALAWLFGCVVGFAISRRWDNPANISSISNMAGYLIVLLPPVYYPLSLLPDAARVPASFIPTATLAEMMRWSVGLSESAPGLMAADVAVTLALIAACIWYTSRDSRWRTS